MRNHSNFCTSTLGHYLFNTAWQHKRRKNASCTTQYTSSLVLLEYTCTHTTYISYIGIISDNCGRNELGNENREVFLSCTGFQLHLRGNHTVSLLLLPP